MRWRPTIAAILVVAAGCSSADPPSATPATEATTASTPAPSSVPSALDFAAPAVGGGTIDVRAYAGSNVAFWFWAPY